MERDSATAQHNSWAIHKDHSLFLLDEPALHSHELNFDLRLFALRALAPPFEQQLVQRLQEQVRPRVNAS